MANVFVIMGGRFACVFCEIFHILSSLLVKLASISCYFLNFMYKQADRNGPICGSP
jgi:hypothetical protein